MMSKCVRISCTSPTVHDVIPSIKKKADKLLLEGLCQLVDKQHVKIVVSGSKEKIDEFIESLYTIGTPKKPVLIEIEPFFKEKDYRGIFRIVA